MRRLASTKRAAVLQALCEGNSISSASRITDVAYNSVVKLLIDAGEACSEFHNRAVRGVAAARLQLDEIWSFTWCKDANVETARNPPEGAGDTWTWIALDADSRLIVSWMVGGRDRETAEIFMADLASRVTTRPQVTTDGLRLYIPAVLGAFDGRVDFAQLTKRYGIDVEVPERSRRYSPPRITGVRRRRIAGDPDEAHVSTSYVERQNLNMRLFSRRFTRLTNGFSRKLENHAHQLALSITAHNFIRINKTLRVTPAMEAGLAGEVRDFKWIVDLIEMNTAPPAPWGSVKRAREASESAQDSV